MAELRDLRVHICALNARDLDTLAAQALAGTPCFCDGEWVGEGPDAVRKALADELLLDDQVFVRLGTLDGEPTMLEFDGGGVEKATLRFRNDARGRLRELRIDHHAGRVVQVPEAPEPSA